MNARACAAYLKLARNKTFKWVHGNRHRMNARWLAVAVILLANCASPQPVAEPQDKCPVFQIPTETGCCRDLNENTVCDTVDFAENISAEKQREEEEAAAQARETAEQSGKLKPTIVNALYENASAVAGYRFYYQGDEVVVANGTIVRRLLANIPLGDKEIAGRRVKAAVNTVYLDFQNRTAVGECVPPKHAAALGRGTECDEFIGVLFPVDFDAYSFKLPIKWLEEFLNRKPYEDLPGGDIGKRKTVRYSFGDLQDSAKKTHLWVDTQTQMPVRAEVWKGDELATQDVYSDFYPI